MNDLSVSFRLDLVEDNLLVCLQNVRVFEDSLLEEELPALSDAFKFLLDNVVLVKIHGDVTYHAETQHMVLPKLVEFRQKVFSVAVFESFFKRQNISLYAFSYFFV